MLVVAHLRKGMSDNCRRKDWSQISSVPISQTNHHYYDNIGFKWLSRLAESPRFLLVPNWNMEVILAVMNTTKVVVRIRLEKNSGLYRIWTQDLCDTCTGVTDVMGHGHGTWVIGSNPVQAWIFFQTKLHYYLSGVHICEDHFHIRSFHCSSHIWFSYIYSPLLIEILSKLLELDFN